ncbi:hypothetical protein [Rhizobium sp. L1K21]|uniref:hypothetical protein n=1 Tax=Rhizobium sp. L1K21 TaxID=2954933 RepID=UPI002093470B|nr:hypothetical protein [Rhizobium sp. L1K21]MCO6186789.1 hypothetical protein [Rhizobium sp. L1K21]
MKTFSKAIVAALFSVSAVAGIANAADRGVSDSHENLIRNGDITAPGATTNGFGYGYKPGFLRKVADDGLTVRYTDELSRASKAAVENFASNPAHLEAIQSQIRQDPALVRAFQARGINIDNVISIEHSFSGDTFYIVR